MSHGVVGRHGVPGSVADLSSPAQEDSPGDRRILARHWIVLVARGHSGSHYDEVNTWVNAGVNLMGDIATSLLTPTSRLTHRLTRGNITYRTHQYPARSSNRRGLPCDIKKLATSLMEPDLLTITEAARKLRISRSQAYRLLGEGTFPVPIITIGSKQMVSRFVLNRFVRGEDVA